MLWQEAGIRTVRVPIAFTITGREALQRDRSLEAGNGLTDIAIILKKKVRKREFSCKTALARTVIP